MATGSRRGARGHPEQEFVALRDASGVGFLPRGYIAPHRVIHELTNRQRELLQVLAGWATILLREISAALGEAVSPRRLREEPPPLKDLGLAEQGGIGRGSVWALRRGREE